MKSVGVNDPSGVPEARRAATDLARRMGFSETDTGKLALIATELSTNLVRHGSGGEILVGAYEDNDSQGIEIIALDKGAGMSNVAACLEDGYSSAGTAGPRPGVRRPAIPLRRHRFVAGGGDRGAGTRRASSSLLHQAARRPDLGRRIRCQIGRGRLRRCLEHIQCGKCPNPPRG